MKHINKLINNLEQDVITTIYGPAGSGKSVTGMMAAIDVIEKGGNVIYIDTEGGFSIERLKQIHYDHQKILDHITFIKPMTFDEQKTIIEKLTEKVTPNIKLIVVDSLSMLYRLDLGKNEEVFESNRELGRQISNLTKLARTFNIPVLLTNQVYTNFENGIKMVGGDMIVYGSKCIIELVKGKNGMRKAILKKHRSQPEGKEINFKLVQEGVDINL